MNFSLQMAAADMFATMLYMLLLTAVTQAAVPMTDSTLPTDQLHTVLCEWTVARRHFAPGRPLVVSLPRTTPDVAHSAFSAPLAQTDGLQTVSVILGKLHEEKDGRLNCSDQMEMKLQAHQFYTTVTFCLCGTERRAAITRRLKTRWRF